MPHRFLRFLALFALVVSVGGAAAAQAQPADQAPVGPTQMVSANPFTLMFQWFNADYERQLTPNTTWGASGSFFSIGDFGYKNANATVRYYPRAALSGFYVGGRSGLFASRRSTAAPPSAARGSSWATTGSSAGHRM